MRPPCVSGASDAALSGMQVTLGGLEVGPPLLARARVTSCFISKRMRLRFAGARPRRTPWARDAALTTVSRQHDVGERRRVEVGPARAAASSWPRSVITNSTGPAAGAAAAGRRARCSRSSSLRSQDGELGGGTPGVHADAQQRDHQHQAADGQPADGEQHGLVPGHSRRPYRPRTIRRIRSHRSLTAASAPSEVGR